MQVRDLRFLTMAVVGLVVLNAVWPPFVAFTVSVTPGWFAAHVAPVATMGDAAQMVVRIVTMIVFGRWMYLAGRNLEAVGTDGLEFTPASRIWWFAVPFANFVKPYQGMRELWNASRGDWPLNVNAPLPAAWWTCWLLNAVAGQALRFAANDTAAVFPILYASALVGIALAATAIALVLGIARGQSALGQEDLSAVFA